jgi:hypothetical protein
MLFPAQNPKFLNPLEKNSSPPPGYILGGSFLFTEQGHNISINTNTSMSKNLEQTWEKSTVSQGMVNRWLESNPGFSDVSFRELICFIADVDPSPENLRGIKRLPGGKGWAIIHGPAPTPEDSPLFSLMGTPKIDVREDEDYEPEEDAEMEDDDSWMPAESPEKSSPEIQEHELSWADIAGYHSWEKDPDKSFREVAAQVIGCKPEEIASVAEDGDLGWLVAVKKKSAMDALDDVMDEEALKRLKTSDGSDYELDNLDDDFRVKRK